MYFITIWDVIDEVAILWDVIANSPLKNEKHVQVLPGSAHRSLVLYRVITQARVQVPLVVDLQGQLTGR